MTNLPIKNQYFVRPYSMIEDGINTFGDELIVVGNGEKLLIWYSDTLFFTYNSSLTYKIAFATSSYVYRVSKRKWRIIVQGIDRPLSIDITKSGISTNTYDEALFFQKNVSRAEITKKLLLGDSIV